MPTPLPLQKLPPLSSLKGFEAAARLLSLRAAAEELNLTHPAIANQIQRLEESLEVKLFAREGRHVVLTAAGERFYPVVREALAGLVQGAESLRQMQHAQPLTIQVYVTTSIRWLAPRLSHFQAMHPKVELKLMTAVSAGSSMRPMPMSVSCSAMRRWRITSTGSRCSSYASSRSAAPSCWATMHARSPRTP
ncbi:LysR family transcriptional regulator [Cobetia marina]